jgi:pimeloyl-ACP methyl ester carboxylesterase
MKEPSWKPLYPFADRLIDLGGYSMHYVDEGQGDNVVMLHGNPTWSFYYRELIQVLSATHRCLAPDHVGMGLSDRPGEPRYKYTLKSRVDDLEQFIERVAPTGPITLVLHDWGGMIGMSWAARHPERVRAIVASNTACFRLPKEKTLPPLLSALRGFAAGVPLRASGFVRARILAGCVAKRRLAPEVKDAYLSVCDGWEESLAVHRFVQDIPLGPGDPAWDVLAATEAKLGLFAKTPMMLAWGMKDWVFDESFLNGWTRRFPQADERRFYDCGHLLLEDSPDEAVAMIAGFVGSSSVAA